MRNPVRLRAGYKKSFNFVYFIYSKHQQTLFQRKTMFNLTVSNFRDDYLYQFFINGTVHNKIPPNLTNVLARKLDMINAAENLNDLRVPPANRLELLEPKDKKRYSIRVNKQYRLIFTFENGELSNLYLDPHTYAL